MQSHSGNSLVVQWLGLGAFTAGPGVQSLVRELRSCKAHGIGKTKQTNKKNPHSLILRYWGLGLQHITLEGTPLS